MIKIKNNIPKDTKDSLMLALTDPILDTYLYINGISIGNYEDYDYVFEEANTLDPDNVLPNTIAFERIDGCQVRNKKLLHCDNVLRLVKMYKYRGLGVNNLSCVDKRIFTRLLVPEEEWDKDIYWVNHKMLSKVTIGLSFWHYLRHRATDEFMKTNQIINNHREIDVFFAGTTEYGKHGHHSGRIISEHRLSCIDAISKLDVDSTLTYPDRHFNYIQYLTQMYNSKIVISPWGWGESCFRDYEAIACGCELIKPESYTIQSNPDIYNNEYMHFCRPDWSNLQEIVNRILKEHQFSDMDRAKRSAYVLEQRKPEVQAKIIKGIIDECNLKNIEKS